MTVHTDVTVEVDSYRQTPLDVSYSDADEHVSFMLDDRVQVRGDYDDVRERLLEALDEMARCRWSPEGRTPLTGKVTA